MSERRTRLLATSLPLHDVRDPEAHVRVLIDSKLNEWGARLDLDLYDDLVAHLLALCWELSGIGPDGTKRKAYYVDVHRELDELDDPDIDGAGPEVLGPFWQPNRALAAAEAAADAGGIATVRTGTPPGAYDPAHGLAFSTYSRRILSLRIVDWYRKTFGDTRYGDRRPTLSLNACAMVNGESVEEFLELRSDVVDDTDDVLTRVAFG